MIGGLLHGNIGGTLGGLGGFALGGPLGSVIGSSIGSKFQNAASKYAGQAAEEAFGMTDLRRSTWGINESFKDFRENIRKAGEGLGVMHNETLRYAQTYAGLSGATGGMAVAAGTREGIRLGRIFGMDPSQTSAMMGRAGWLGLGGGDIRKQAQMLAEAMAGSNLGARQSEAAEAMLRYAEKNSSILGGAGNVGGMMGFMRALFNSPDAGIKANAVGILGGYDDAVRSGGRAGDAGKNFIYRMLAANGVSDPADVEMALEGGFAGEIGKSGKMIGPELLRRIRAQYGHMGKNWMALATKGLFGGHANVALKVQDLLEQSPGMDDGTMKARVEALMRDYGDGKGNDADMLRTASANLNNAAQELMGDRMLTLMSNIKDVLADLTQAINQAFNGKKTLGDQSLVGELNAAHASRQQASAFGAWGIGRRAAGGWTSLSKNWRQDDDFMAQVDAIASQYGIRPSMARALLAKENAGGDLYATSRTGVRGLWQTTAGAMQDAGFTADDRFDPVRGTHGAMKYMAGLLAKYGGDETKALAAWNNGMGNIDKGNYVIPLSGGGSQDAGAFARAVLALEAALRNGIPVNLTVDQHGNVRKGAGPSGMIPVPGMR